MDFLFDIGNVIVGVDFIPSLLRLIPEGVDDVSSRIDILIERKDEFEAGRISSDEYFPWAAEVLGYTGSLDTFLDEWKNIFSPNEAMWKSIKCLHDAGHRLFLFSNIQSEHRHYLEDYYEVFQYFSGGVYSYQTGFVKPEPEIYQEAIRRCGLEPDKTLYIDDLPANIEGGRKVGFRCWQYDRGKHDMFLDWLRDQLECGE